MSGPPLEELQDDVRLIHAVMDATRLDGNQDRLRGCGVVQTHVTSGNAVCLDRCPGWG